MKVNQPRPSLPVTQTRSAQLPEAPRPVPNTVADGFESTPTASLLPSSSGPGATGVSSITTDRTTWVRDGASGTTVADLQQKLKDAGFDPGPLDGKFGPQTRAAVLAFQQSKGIQVDGIVGPETRAALLGEPLPTRPEGPSGADEPASPDAPSGPSGPSGDPGNVQAANELERMALQKHGPEFVQKVRDMAGRLGVKPEWILAVMKNESGMDPKARNPNGGATGLIQFMPATARGLGTTTEALSRMSATEQLAYVEKYYAPFKGRINSGTDLYLATFWPAAVGKPDSYNIGGAEVARVNGIFDLNKNGQITAGEFREYYRRKFPALA